MLSKEAARLEYLMQHMRRQRDTLAFVLFFFVLL